MLVHLKHVVLAVMIAAASCSSPASASNTQALDDKVGWYVMDDGSHRMLTWGAAEGLLLNDLASQASRRLLPISDDIFSMVLRDVDSSEVRFLRDDGGNVTGFEWTDAAGRAHRGRRTDGFGYDQREVYYGNTTHLAGLLLVPSQPGPHPAVVLMHGFGPVDRENIQHLYQADYLARRGVVVLLPDMRGCGKSGGSWITSTLDSLADDALAGVAFLRDHEGVDQTRIGVVGLDEGGWVAPLAARRSTDVGFAVNVSGSAVTPNDQIRHEISANLREYGTPDFLVPLIAYALERRSKHRHRIWWNLNGDFDAAEHWSYVECPVLVVYGDSEDRETVPVRDSVVRLEEARSRSGNAAFTIEVFPDTRHEMIDPATEWIRSEYLSFLTTWILGLSTS